MSQAYSDPSRESDPHALPDVEVFYVNVTDQNAGWGDLNATESGWYWWSCMPGCLPDADPTGPFKTEQEAIADAQSGNE